MSNLEGKRTAAKKTTKQNPNQTNQNKTKTETTDKQKTTEIKKMSKPAELERKIKRMREGEQFCVNP